MFQTSNVEAPSSAEAQDQFTQFLVAVLSHLAVFVGGQLMRDYGVAALEPTRQLLRGMVGKMLLHQEDHEIFAPSTYWLNIRKQDKSHLHHMM